MALLNNADAIYFGDRPVDRIYLGARQVWPWTPELLFQNGEQGALYSLTPDFTGLYQDSAGTTPVTAVGQPVGLMLDRRFGLAQGVELIPQPVNITSGWATSGADITGPKTFVNTSAVGRVNRLGLLQVGKTYGVTFDCSRSMASGLFGIYNGSSGSGNPVYTVVNEPTVSGSAIFVAADTAISVRDSGGIGSVTTINTLSIRELPGNHASQPTTTARPALRSGPLRIDYDGADDFLRTTFPSALGSNVTIARSIPGFGAQILTGQTVGTEWDDNVTSCATLVIDRALTGSETALVTAFLNQQAGV